MSDDFYEVLGLQADASAEDVRRAYRKKALQTHPDRLPPGATTEDKRGAEERFRKVNNAYEVLMDAKNRKLYDLYGVWPPPENFADKPSHERNHHASSRRPDRPPPAWEPFNDPFFNSAFPVGLGDPFRRHRRPRSAFVFRDPFELFNAMFADMQDELYYGPGPWFTPPDPFFPRPTHILSRTPANFGPSLFPPSVFHALDMPVIPGEPSGGASRPDARQNVFSFESSSRGFYDPRSNSNSPQWVSESRVVRTVNGVTQSVWKRKDRNGNEHITYTDRDGRERYTLNGVEQSHPAQSIQDAAVHPQYSTSAPVIPPEQVEASSKKRWWSRH